MTSLLVLYLALTILTDALVLLDYNSFSLSKNVLIAVLNDKTGGQSHWLILMESLLDCIPI